MLNYAIVNEDNFLILRDEWESLLKEADDPDFFSTWEWNYYWWKNFKENKILLLLTFRDNDNNLVGIFPGCIIKHSCFGLFKIKVLQFIGRGIDKNSIGEYSDFLDVIAHRKFKNKVYESLIQYFKSQNGQFDIIYLNVLKETSTFFLYLKNNINNSFKLSRIEKGPLVYFAALPDSIDEYLTNLSSSFRATMRRKVRKWEKNFQDRLFVVQDNQAIIDFYNNFFRLVHKRHQKIMNEERVIFHQDVANFSLTRNRFWGIFTKIDDAYSAVAVIYSYRDKAYFYQHAINPQYAKYSPGTVLLYYTFEKIIKDGINRFEFLQGRYDYKKQMGKEHHYLVNIYLGSESIKSKIYFFLYAISRMIKESAKKFMKWDWSLIKKEQGDKSPQ